jgi:ribose/xylose/arabinose/galactoside ABC-type transport system permease subunit
VARTKVGLFITQLGMLAGLAGIISSIRTSAANPNSGTGYELEVIAMVVIGGTALAGGRGTIIGTVLGIFILRVDAQRHRDDRRAGACLQHLHRRDHPWHDGAAFLA